ncbi:G-type lectin S-receptor-like serine/threonine-protein kinase B120 isoform X2 [Triticum dicoccoides]|uniref:G-type lectin S-receptor-like serine/threonine-protein kinase B120 isoform X2 n=1 Tax=Triticum dicoccoides TaxID=85692 RepID=UPI00188F9755|nr:G-type lectin S-receptor-like serine/threonine-protein kinase B120 isoform X2 [Triticum dicoccoides]
MLLWSAQTVYFALLSQAYVKESLSSMTLRVIFTLLLLVCFCESDDRLTPAKPLLPGDKLVSNNGIFALGFFSLDPENSTAANSYVGIWYHDIPERTYVWVANRDNPIGSGLSGELVLTNTSDLVLSDSEGHILWRTTNKVTSGGDGAMALLLEAGNFVVQLQNFTQIWQSYDHPTDTILPSFKLWANYKTHTAVRLVAWKGPLDPSPGKFLLSRDPGTGLQILTLRGTSKYWRSGLWNGAQASDKNGYMWSQNVDDGETIYSTYNTGNSSARRSHWKLDYNGDLMLRIWTGRSWVPLFKRPDDGCRHYGSCGPFGYCDMFDKISGECKCLDGFRPADGFSANPSRGCVRKENLTCRSDHFLTLPEMKVPDKFVYVRNRSFEECTAECERDCSCTAYAYTNLSSIVATGGPSRCLIWTGELVDSEKAGMLGGNLYIRLAGSPEHSSAVNTTKSGVSVVFKIALPVITFLLTLTCIYLVCICKQKGIQVNKETLKKPALKHLSTSQEVWDQNLEFQSIMFEDIAAATNSFHDTNVLGKGGFGKVYKGILEDGKEVAVKRLSKGSDQGIEHFRNEVVLIAKLQHKNLVRLLGCCIHEDEKLLIYEYLPNKSLDQFLFDIARKFMLDWPKRFNIIKGVARGLMYLHQDSRTTIIHRDLKPSNILLDVEMNPKISDFGMARIFGGNEQQESTRRVVGTYGYMSPEYAMEGIFSVKSDTYSFGILLLEIAWNLWADGKVEDFVDPAITESYSLDEVSKCIHVGLLCVQDSSGARPHMSSVVSMLDSEAMPRAAPRQPMYFAQINCETSDATEDLENSANGVSLTALEGR